MNAKLSAGLMTAVLLALAAPVQAAQPDGLGAASVAAPQVDPMAMPARAGAPMADPRFAPYCLKDTGSVIVAMQNRRAEREAKANGTKPQLRCTATGIALKVNPDGVPVPDQGVQTRVR